MTRGLLTLIQQAREDADPGARRGDGPPRLTCTCGHPIADDHPGQHASWDSWRCTKCGAWWCPDCGAPVDQSDGQCTAYTAQQEEWASIAAENAAAV